MPGDRYDRRSFYLAFVASFVVRGLSSAVKPPLVLSAVANVSCHNKSEYLVLKGERERGGGGQKEKKIWLHE